jgi:hypothetical protein
MADNKLTQSVKDSVKPVESGALFWKIRGPNQWYRRRYHVLMKDMVLVYEPSMKLFGSDSSRKRTIRFVLRLLSIYLKTGFPFFSRLGDYQRNKKRLENGHLQQSDSRRIHEKR